MFNLQAYQWIRKPHRNTYDKLRQVAPAKLNWYEKHL